MQITNGTRTVDVRIDNDSELFNYSFPTSFPLFGITFTGLGGQFDSSIPRTSGYQLIPRKISDIFIPESVGKANPSVSWSIHPNPSTTPWKLSGISSTEPVEMVVLNGLGQKVISAKGSKETVEQEISSSWSAINQGIYFIQARVKGISSSKTVVKN